MIEGEILFGRAHHVIYFNYSDEWQNYPEWAQNRRDEMIRVWDAVSGEQLRAQEIPADSVKRVAWSPDGTLLASGSTDGTVQLWGILTGSK